MTVPPYAGDGSAWNAGRRFTTYETVEEVPLRVVKKNGIREMFDRNKLRNGLIRAC